MTNPKSQKIIALLRQGKTTQEIAVHLGLKHHSLMQTLNRMRKAGLVHAKGQTTDRCYEVSQVVSQAVASGVASGVASPSQAHTIKNKPYAQAQAPAKPETYRQHAVWIEAQVAKLSEAQIQQAEQKVKRKGIRTAGWAIKNNYVGFLPDVQGYEVYIYPNIMKIVPPDAEQPQNKAPLMLLQQRTLRQAYNIMPEIERLTGLKIDASMLYVVREEVAETHNPMAKEVFKTVRKLKITHPRTGEVCFVMDKSKEEATRLSLDEAEGTLPATNPHHIRKLDDLRSELGKAGQRSMVNDLHAEGTKNLLEDHFHKDGWTAQKTMLKEAVDKIDQLATAQLATNKFVSDQAKLYQNEFALVDRLTRQVELHLRLMQKIDQKLSQKSLKEW